MAKLIDLHALPESEWEAYLRCSDPQLLHFHEPDRGLFLAESPNVIERALNAGYEPVSLLIDKKQITPQVEEILLRCGDVPAYLAETAVLQTITGFHLTRGVLCAMRRRALPDMAETVRHAKRIALLENVMNPTNLGAIFRSAAALHVDALLLTTGCTDPLYRRACRVSMGTVFQVPWGYCAPSPDAADAVRALREMGFVTAAMALTDRSLPIDALHVSKETPLALVLGTEGEGLHAETIAACDHVIRIPMRECVDSLNVAAASAVAFWQFRVS